MGGEKIQREGNDRKRKCDERENINIKNKRRKKYKKREKFRR